MRSFTYTLTGPVGIRARPAGMLVKQVKNYSRYVMHIRYLLQRMEQNTQEVNGMSFVMRQLMIQHPEIYHWRCNQDEMLYLFMHINRLKERSIKS